jgi:HEAT repeat protein
MRKYRRIVLVMVLVSLGAAALWVPLTREPIYEGKSLSIWLENLNHGDSKIGERAQAVLRAAGPEVIPHLVRALKTRNSSLRQAYMEIREMMPTFVIDRIPYPKHHATYRYGAAKALGQFGPAAESAVPQLKELLKDDNEMVCWAAAETLGRIGPTAREVTVDLLALTNSSVALTRVWAAWALWRIDPTSHTTASTRILTGVLTENYLAGKEAVDLLEDMGQLRPAVTVLVEALKAPAAKTRIQAADLLERIGPGAKEAVGALTLALEDSDRHVRRYAAKALGRIGPEARSALPQLQQGLKAAEGISLKIYTEAIQKIDVGTAAVQK